MRSLSSPNNDFLLLCFVLTTLDRVHRAASTLSLFNGIKSAADDDEGVTSYFIPFDII